MSFDEEHLSEHHECQAAVAELEQRLSKLAALLDTVAAEARAGMKEQAARIPEQQARNLEDVVRSNVVGADQVDQLWIDRLREEHEEFCRMAAAIRALQPDPALVVVSKSDLAHYCNECECSPDDERHYGDRLREHVLARERMRAAIDRLRAGEE